MLPAMLGARTIPRLALACCLFLIGCEEMAGLDPAERAAMAAYDSGQYEKSRGHFEALHKLGPGDWFVIRKLIQCNERLGDAAAVQKYRDELEKLRQQKGGSEVLKRYAGLTRDYIPVGT